MGRSNAIITAIQYAVVIDEGNGLYIKHPFFSKSSDERIISCLILNMIHHSLNIM
jgi:hypothetical protein